MGERLKAAPPPFQKRKKKVGGPPVRPASHTDTRVLVKQNFIFKRQQKSPDEKEALEGPAYQGAKREVEEALQKVNRLPSSLSRRPTGRGGGPVKKQ